jgi:hypothetical protein
MAAFLSWLIATPTLLLLSVVADSHSNSSRLQGELPFAPTIRHSPFAIRCRSFPVAIRQSLPFPVVADSLMADTKVCPYHSLFATRYSLPFDQSPIAIRQSLPFFRCFTKTGRALMVR